jgi:hypothetical protein
LSHIIYLSLESKQPTQCLGQRMKIFLILKNSVMPWHFLMQSFSLPFNFNFGIFGHTLFNFLFHLIIFLLWIFTFCLETVRLQYYNLVVFFFFLWYWGLNSKLCTCQVGPLPLESCCQCFLLWLFLI